MAAQNTATLETYFETDDIPTQAQFASLIQSFQNVVDLNLLQGKDAAVTAIYPATQGTATQLTLLANNISAGGAGNSGVVLPSSLQCKYLFVRNNAGVDISVFPASGEYVGINAINVAMTLGIGECALFYAGANGRWEFFRSSLVTRSLLQYKAKISQSGTSAPTATVIVNTLGIVPTWAYVSPGVYSITATGLLNANNTFVRINNVITGPVFATSEALSTPNSWRIRTYNLAGVATNALLNGTPFEMDIYSA